jgi:hypothetical protein
LSTKEKDWAKIDWSAASQKTSAWNKGNVTIGKGRPMVTEEAVRLISTTKP